jgi:hypothetical protein
MEFTTNLASQRRKGIKSAFLALALGVVLAAAAVTVPLWPTPAAADDAKGRPDCYVLSVGIDGYCTPGLCKLSGCEHDAVNLANRMKDQAGTLFGAVDSRLVLSQDATGPGLRASMADIAARGKAGDWVVLVLSGHGGIDTNGRWQFATVDGQHLVDTDLLEWADKLAAQGKKAWIIVDACHSGQLRLNARELLERYQDPQGGGVLLMVATVPAETSLAMGQYSAYAQSVNEALAGDADFNGDGTVTLREVRQYAYNRAFELTHKATRPDQNGECVASLSIADSQPLAQVKTATMLRVNSQLTRQDPRDKVRKDCYGRGYAVNLKAGTRYVIDLKSTAFDAYLRIEDGQGRELASNDDVGGLNRNSQVVFTPNVTGSYRIVATTCFGNRTGSFSLTVKQGS